MKKLVFLLVLLAVAPAFAESFDDSYNAFKEKLAQDTGFSYGLQATFLAQRVAPQGGGTALQTYYYPYASYEVFKDTAYGSGAFNFEAEIVRYPGTDALALAEKAGHLSAMNTYPTYANTLLSLNYTHTLPGDMSWLSLTAGQYSLYCFDGTPYTFDQHTYLINMTFDVSASAVYPLGGFGGYATARKDALSINAGAQTAANIAGNRIAAKTIFDGRYNSFVFTEYKPDIAKLGNGIYSFLLYYQNNEDDLADSRGWSFNAQQDIGAKWAAFGKANGVQGPVLYSGIRQSYVLGLGYKDPLERGGRDIILFAAGYNRPDREQFDFAYEKIYELMWVFSFTSFMTITPDIQLYDSALGGGKTSFVYGLRTTFYL